MFFSVHSCVNLKTGNSNTANRVVHQDVATWGRCAEKCHQSAECNNWSWVSKNHANAELHFDCYFFTGNDVSTIANDHMSRTKESWNCLQTTGQIDGVTWSDVMANRLLDKEHTIAATYTFAAPTKKLHFQEEILGNGDEDNAELNGQKISSMRTAKEILGAVGNLQDVTSNLLYVPISLLWHLYQCRTIARCIEWNASHDEWSTNFRSRILQ